MSGCYCCGQAMTQTVQIRRGLQVSLCADCLGSQLTRDGFVCPTHGKPVPFDVDNVSEPLQYPVVGKGGTRIWGFVYYTEVKPGKDDNGF